MSTVLVNAIAEVLGLGGFDHNPPSAWLPEANAAADACIAVVAAMPADYTAVDVLAALRGEDVPSEHLPAKVAVVPAPSHTFAVGDSVVIGGYPHLADGTVGVVRRVDGSGPYPVWVEVADGTGLRAMSPTEISRADAEATA